MVTSAACSLWSLSALSSVGYLLQVNLNGGKLNHPHEEFKIGDHKMVPMITKSIFLIHLSIGLLLVALLVAALGLWFS
jgi:hypothetical protein